MLGYQRPHLTCAELFSSLDAVKSRDGWPLLGDGVAYPGHFRCKQLPSYSVHYDWLRC